MQLYAVITMKYVKAEQAITGNTQAADVLRNICITCSYMNSQRFLDIVIGRSGQQKNKGCFQLAIGIVKCHS